jgi:hypothetical protein
MSIIHLNSFRSAVPPLSTYQKEMAELIPLLRKQHPTLVFCHGEPNPTNIIYVEKEGKCHPRQSVVHIREVDYFVLQIFFSRF